MAPRRVDLETAVDAFLQTKRTESTGKAYGQTLKQAVKLLNGMKVYKASGIEFNHVHALFHDDRKGWPSRKPAPSAGTLNNHRSRLGVFFGWCVRMGYMEMNLINNDDFPRLRSEEVVMRRFTHDELDLIISSARSPRDRALLACCAYTGLRIGEAVALTVGQVNMEEADLQYYDYKNKAWKWKPMYPAALKEIAEWLCVYQEQLGEPLRKDMLLFPRMAKPTFRGSRWTTPEEREIFPYLEYRGKNAMLNTLLDSLDREHGLTGTSRLNRSGQAFHMFRRSAGRLMYDRLADPNNDDGTRSQDKALRLVQAYLGHTTRAITESYIGLDTEYEELAHYVKGKSFRPEPPTPSAAELPANVYQLKREA